MKRMIILVIGIFTLTSCASSLRWQRNYEIWFPGRVAQQNQLKGKMGNGCEINQKRIFRRRY